MRRYLVAGNWKMNTTAASAAQLARSVIAGCSVPLANVDVLICPPFPFLGLVNPIIGATGVNLGAQNVHQEEAGAFTGEVSLPMLKDVGCRAVIIGHSERRHVFGETDETINKKVLATRAAGLQAILCVGELLSERDADETEAVLNRQMAGGLANVGEEAMADVVIAYEPVWAIGTGRTATPEQAETAQAHLRNWLSTRYNSQIVEAARIVYGGSVTADNARQLLEQPNVDGALVGGASLNAESFLSIVQAAVAAGTL